MKNNLSLFRMSLAQSKVFERGYASMMRLFDSPLTVRRHYESREIRGRTVLYLCRCMGKRECLRRHMDRNLKRGDYA